MAIEQDIAAKVRQKTPALFGEASRLRYTDDGASFLPDLNTELDRVAVEIANELNAESGYTPNQIGRALLIYFLSLGVKAFKKKSQDNLFDSTLDDKINAFRG